MSAPAACTISPARLHEILYRGQAGPVDWQAAERAERRWDAKVARTLIVALPHELSLRAQINLVAAQANWLRESRGVAVTWAVHEAPGDPRNRHGHLVITTRRVDENGTHGKKTRELDRARRPASPSSHAGGTVGSSSSTPAWPRRDQTRASTTAASRRVASTRPARMHLGLEQAEQERQGYRTVGGRHNAKPWTRSSGSMRSSC